CLSFSYLSISWSFLYCFVDISVLSVSSKLFPYTTLFRSEAKRMGFTDRAVARLCGTTEEAVRSLRRDLDIRPVYKRVDTCAAELDRKSTRLNSSHVKITYAVFCLKKKKNDDYFHVYFDQH